MAGDETEKNYGTLRLGPKPPLFFAGKIHPPATNVKSEIYLCPHHKNIKGQKMKKQTMVFTLLWNRMEEGFYAGAYRLVAQYYGLPLIPERPRGRGVSASMASKASIPTTAPSSSWLPPDL
ncbi:MAG: hypothetical protein LBL81_00755 [Tannerella sp.]|nr:hypothetical protein [Tannerella sp.]